MSDQLNLFADTDDQVSEVPPERPAAGETKAKRRARLERELGTKQLSLPFSQEQAPQ